jgi:hypothetical protein
MTKQEKLETAEAIAEHTIDYIYETVAELLSPEYQNTDDEYDEDQFIAAHDEVMRLTIIEIAKRLTNINGVSTLLNNMK